jgi:hypothetical protein
LKKVLNGKIPLSDIIKQSINPSVFIVKFVGFSKNTFEFLWLPIIIFVIKEN